MYRILISAWEKLKENVVIYATLLGLLFVAFQSGVKIKKKSIEEKEESLKNNEKLILQTAQYEKDRLKFIITNLKNQKKSLEKDNKELKDKMINTEKKYETLVNRLQQMTVDFSALKERNEKTIAQKKKVEKVLASNRPFLDYKKELIYENGGIKFSLYNKSDTPLKIVEVDHLSLSNGNMGGKNKSVKSTILHPGDKKLTFSYSHNKMSKVRSGEIDYRGGFCAKYTTLNKDDHRYWVYEVWFIYNSTDSEYNVVKEFDKRVGSTKQLNIEKMLPNGWSNR